MRKWRLELRQAFPFGFDIFVGDEAVISQDGPCWSSEQKTREDHETGVGFPHYPSRNSPNATTRAQAAALVALQTARAALIVRAVNAELEMGQNQEAAVDRAPDTLANLGMCERDF